MNLAFEGKQLLLSLPSDQLIKGTVYQGSPSLQPSRLQPLAYEGFI
jgi:hypothetical protein